MSGVRAVYIKRVTNFGLFRLYIRWFLWMIVLAFGTSSMIIPLIVHGMSWTAICGFDAFGAVYVLLSFGPTLRLGDRLIAAIKEVR